LLPYIHVVSVAESKDGFDSRARYQSDLTASDPATLPQVAAEKTHHFSVRVTPHGIRTTT